MVLGFVKIVGVKHGEIKVISMFHTMIQNVQGWEIMINPLIQLF